MLDVCLPGTGGMLPLPERWLSCCRIEYQGKTILIDCGEGTQLALREAGFKLSRLDILLFTHYHADHIGGLPGLLLTLGAHGKTSPLMIAGPKGLRAVYAALTTIAPVLPYPVELVELHGGPGSLDAGDIQISYLPLDHGVRCLGYRVSLLRKPIFNPRKAEALAIPKKLYGPLHAGQQVRLDDGRLIDPGLVTDGQRDPISVCYITDSAPTAAMADLARGVDLLVCEGMHGDDAMRQKMDEKGHMVYSDAAGLARDAGAKALWLTHFSPALKTPEAFLDSARAFFPNTCVGYDGIRTTL